MKSYSYIVVFIYKLFFFYFMSFQAFAQENDGDILSPPQNIVPEILEEEIIDNEATSANILNEVIIDDLPNNKPVWIGNLSFEDGGIAFYQSIAYGVEVIFPYESPKNKFFRSSVKFNIRNTKSAAEQIKLIDKYKIRKSENINFNFSYLVKEFQLTKQSIETWISWM